ncbi:PREDICTED: XK-related protein 6 [Ceratosolen solmsi marchali]|uniref:XK-related protein n=1 Tax=Ceratosolen solmsi marchali TaxID=326594 RepID=A0AAJ6YH92_9HYME|nr:PREDICTED: XK-related protein 6 [Ceratosolen solmsi marchali]
MEFEDNISPVIALNDFARERKEDVPDIPPKSSKISNLDIFLLILSIITHCTDFFIDINLVVQYYLNNKLQMFAWTISLIMIPSFINTIVSVQMYHQDEENNTQNKCTRGKTFFKKMGQVIVVLLIVVLQFTMAYRCFLSLKYAIQSRNCKRKDDKVGQRKYFIKMLKEEQDIALLRVLECFIEAAPQQILQLSIFVQDYYGEFSIMTLHQIISIISSFISLAWAMVSYHRGIRLAQVDKKNINFAGSVLQFLWHLFITTSRIASVAAVAIFSTFCVILACFFHWIGMTIWIIMESRGLIVFCQDPNRAPHLPRTIIERIKSILFTCVLGFIYIFIYLNPDDSGTYTKHLFYYTVCLLENISASILILLSVPSNIDIVWYHYLISATCIISFIIGVIIMIFYYLKFHPSMKHHTFYFSKFLRLR